MTYTAAMLDSHPAVTDDFDRKALVAAIDAAFDCAQACSTCATACLAEKSVADLRPCIRTDLACADICDATGRVLSRQPADDLAAVRALLEACVTVCAACAAECETHAAMHEHCRICAEACRRCEQACRELLGSMT
ncbi:MAG TPA: four-helix bundle copper-binding protein [Jiangellales bacterium]|nr:four-helix bundle copper-binding protein [Jiangellales bacterium]